MQVYCDFTACLYNDDGCCDKEKIFLNIGGLCTSYVYISDDSEEGEKQE